MRKNRLLGVAFLAALFTANVFAGIKTSTAWFNGETFEAITASTNFKAATSGFAWDGWSGWTQVSGTSCLVSAQNVGTNYNPEYGGATGICFGIGTNSTTLTASASGSNVTSISKTFTNTLTGYVYIKTAYLPSLGTTSYAFKNSSGTTVFELLGADATSKSLSCTGVSTTTMNLGVRQKWAAAEILLDINSNLAKSVKVTYNGTTRSFTDISLPAGTNINTLSISLGRYFVGGLDNTTIGQLTPDDIRNITGATNLQSVDGSTQSTNFNVQGFSTVMSVDLPFSSSTDVPVTWSISDWGTMSVEDQGKVSISSSGNNLQATLSVNAATAADATITVRAVSGSTTLTKTITINGASIDGVKALLNTEMTTATSLRDNVSASNQYITGIKATLTSAISAANNVYTNSSSASEVTNATATLQAAEIAFSNSMTPYNTFVTYIGTVTSGRDAEVRTAPFFTAIKAPLTSAIGTATAAELTVTSTIDISDSQAALEAAYTQFTTDKPAYDNLNGQITIVSSRLSAVNIRKGDAKFLMFPTANVQTLTDAKTAAENTRDNATTASDMSTAQTTVTTALTTFNNAGRVGLGTSFYRIYTNGADGGDGTTTRSILFAEGTTLKYKTNSNALDANSIWKITEISTDHYTLQNMGTGNYLNGNTLSASPTTFTFPENKSQSGYATWMTDYNSTTKLGTNPDSYFLYSIVNSTPRSLEVDTWTSPTGIFALYNGAIPERYRYCFQFEPVPTLPASSSGSTSSSTNWSLGTAPTTDDIVVAGSLIIDQDANSLGNINIISGGQLTVNAGKKLTIGAGTFANNGTFTLASDNTNGTATFVNSAATAKAITATVNQHLSSGRNWYVSSPISTAPFSALSSAASVQYWNEPTGTWLILSDGSLTVGKGYVSVATASTGNISFNGTLNDGEITVPVTRTVGATKAGFNLVANPYPSYLNAMAAINANAATIEPTIWYRTKGVAYSFETVNTASGEGTNGVTGYIPPMQAFWVKVLPNANPLLDNSGSLVFTNAMRYHANPVVDLVPVTTTPMKSRSSLVPASKIRLQVSNGTNSDEALIYTNENALNTFDLYDSRKMSNENPAIPEIYSLVGAENLVINGLNRFEPNQVLPLGFKTGASTSLSIKAKELTNLDADIRVILIDNVLKTETDLTNGSDYVFASEEVNTPNRFSILFKSQSITTGVDNRSFSGDVQIFRTGNNMISVRSNQNATVKVYNLAGQQLFSTNISGNEQVIQQRFAAGIYLVTVTVNEQPYTQRVIIN